MPAYGDLVIIVTPKGKRSLRRVDENQDMHTQDGILRMADVVEAPFGSEVCTTLGTRERKQEAARRERLGLDDMETASEQIDE